jgi:hypothetical protein
MQKLEVLVGSHKFGCQQNLLLFLCRPLSCQFAFSFVNLVLIQSFRVVSLTYVGSCIPFVRFSFVSLVLIQFHFGSVSCVPKVG